MWTSKYQQTEHQFSPDCNLSDPSVLCLPPWAKNRIKGNWESKGGTWFWRISDQDLSVCLSLSISIYLIYIYIYLDNPRYIHTSIHLSIWPLGSFIYLHAYPWSAYMHTMQISPSPFLESIPKMTPGEALSRVPLSHPSSGTSWVNGIWGPFQFWGTSTFHVPAWLIIEIRFFPHENIWTLPRGRYPPVKPPRALPLWTSTDQGTHEIWKPTEMVILMVIFMVCLMVINDW